MTPKKLWLGFIAVMTISFAVLIYYGFEIYREAPPIPDKVVTTDGTVLFTGQEIRDGQNVWQSMGGQELGTVWGHGAYQAPDWSADWLHKEAIFILNKLAVRTTGKSYDEQTDENKAALKVTLQRELRKNSYDPQSKTITISADRAEAIADNGKFYGGLFTNDPKLLKLREAYSIRENALNAPERVKALTAFFFWTSWACVTQRAGQDITYTNNWPAEELVGNHPTGALILWTGFSVIMLLAGIGLMVFYYARRRLESADEIPSKFPLADYVQTPSQKATVKYFWIVSALLLVQVLAGIITAHYTVEGQGFYGLPLAQWIPY